MTAISFALFAVSVVATGWVCYLLGISYERNRPKSNVELGLKTIEDFAREKKTHGWEDLQKPSKSPARFVEYP